MISKTLVSGLLVVLVLVAEVSVAGGEELSRGAQLLAGYKHDLQQTLRQGLSQGVVEAVSSCKVMAPGIAESLSKEGVRVGRSSHRLRNPDNVAPDWVEPVLAKYAAGISDREPRSVSLADGRLGYVEPIILQPVCAACHGKSLANEVAMRIEELYPADQAVGFEVGGLRGVFWVEYPVQK